MKWMKPPLSEPMRDYFIDGENGWRICKAFCSGVPVYTLSRRGALVETSRNLDELKQMADAWIGPLPERKQ